MLLLTYYPHPGDILICDFDAGGFRPPEMVKRRPVVVVSCRESHGRRLCTVVPISTTVPNPVAAWHHPLPDLKIPPYKDTASMWAKCDMLATVAFTRLDKPYQKTRVSGRVYVDLKVGPSDLAAIKACLKAYLTL